MKKVLYLDFEGSHAKGIREIGYLITEEKNIKFAEEKTDDEAVKCLAKLQTIEFEYIVSHNSFVEKNLIKKYFPYKLSQGAKGLHKQMWVDSLHVYRTLYPNLEKYDLKYLVNTFINYDSLDAITKSRCQKKASTFHHSLFDAICVYLLIKRLSSKINLLHFLR